MQPYAIVKNRSYSVLVWAVFGTSITTAVVIGRDYVIPYVRQRKANKLESFADDYYLMHEKQKAAQDAKLE